MSINEIFNGKEGEFPGLIPLIKDYLKDVDLDVDTSCTLLTYLRFIRKKASGDLQTTATWLRNFVEKHPDYQHDSVVSEKINYDLMKTCRAIANGEVHDSNLLIKRLKPASISEDGELSDEEKEWNFNILESSKAWSGFFAPPPPSRLDLYLIYSPSPPLGYFKNLCSCDFFKKIKWIGNSILCFDIFLLHTRQPS